MAEEEFDVHDFVLNCIETVDTKNDWTVEQAEEAGVLDLTSILPQQKDLREPWWRVRHQRETGACVGFAAADGVLRWLYVKKGLITDKQQPSPRFIWMANKETDNITAFPTTFIETAGTQTKLALRVALKYGCVLEDDLPMDNGLSPLSTAAFYTKAARFRITSYHNLRDSHRFWKLWIAYVGPVLTRLGVDETWDKATSTNGVLKIYKQNTVRGGHAVCLVGYTRDYFIVRNSWGENWGDNGFGYAHWDYAEKAFTDAYGAVLQK